MKILQIDRVEMPTPKDPKKDGLLINVHLEERCIDEEEMIIHAKSILKKEKLRKFAGAAVVYWFQSESERERIYAYEV